MPRHARPAQTCERFTLYHLDSPDAWDGIFKWYQDPDVRRSWVLNNVLQVAKKNGADVLVEEHDYVDADYRNEFQALYGTSFRCYDGRSIRLHLLRNEKDSQLQLAMLLAGADSDVTYLGNVCLRPTGVAVTGRTLLRPPNTDICEGNHYYFLCSTRCKSHLGAGEWSYEAAPFIQQDGMVNCCAQASAWMAARYLSDRLPHEFRRVLPCEITEAASSIRSTGRSLPSTAMFPFELAHALEKLGYGPIYLNLQQRTESAEKEATPEEKLQDIYPYVESRLPVILFTRDHALAVVGHTFDPDHVPDAPEANAETCDDSPVKPPQFLSSSSWVTALIVHDDAWGPYRLLPVHLDTFPKSPPPPLPLPPADKRDRPFYRDLRDITGAIVPLPKKVFLDGATALAKARGVLSQRSLHLEFVTQTLKHPNPGAEILIRALQPEKKSVQDYCVLRPYLTLSTEYRINVEGSARAEKLKALTRDIDLPRWIWVVEVTTAGLLSKAEEDERRILGEIIYDATQHRFRNDWIACHLPGLFIDGRLHRRPIPDDEPYPHFTRRQNLHRPGGELCHE